MAFYVYPERDHTLVLHETYEGRSFKEDPAVVRQQLLPFLETAPSRLVYLAVYGPAEPHAWILRTLRAQGYASVHDETHLGGIMMVFERTEPSSDPTAG